MFSEEEKKQNSGAQFGEQDAVYYRGKTYEDFNVMRQDDVDVTLLVGYYEDCMVVPVL